MGFGSTYSRSSGSKKASEAKQSEPTFSLGDELAFTEKKSEKPMFVFGGKTQTPGDFDRQIVSRFGGKFDQAWEEAMKIVESQDKETLLSQRKFYEEVYKPRRDALAKKWSDMSGKSQDKTSSVHRAKIKVKAD
jgi:hypothetical protein